MAKTARKELTAPRTRKPKTVTMEEVEAAYEPIENEDDQAEDPAPATEEPEAQAPAEDPPVAVGENPVPQFDAEHLTGQVGDWLLAELKMARHVKPWNELTEVQQRQLIARCFSKASELVSATVQAIANRGFPSIDAVFDAGAFKGEELVIKIKALRTPANIAACGDNGRIVQLVFCDQAQFAGAMISKAEPDQPALIADDEETASDVLEEVEEEHDPETGEIAPASSEPQPVQAPGA